MFSSIRSILIHSIWIFLFPLLILPVLADNTDTETDKQKLAQTENQTPGPESESEKSPTENPLQINVEDILSVDKISDTYSKIIDDTLLEYNLSNSILGYSLASLVLAFALTTLFFIIRYFGKIIRQWLLEKYHFISISEHRLKLYQSVLHWILVSGLLVAFCAALTIIWTDSYEDYFANDVTISLAQNLISIIVVAFIGAVIFEALNSGLDYSFSRFVENNRANTLYPIIKNIVLGTFFILMTLTILSQLGINVLPLLAGAGVIGFAIGFGAQTLVKDLLTGFTIIIEDLFKVGDVVSVGGQTGLVEKITIRKVQLRNLEGKVSTVPFSEISVVENLTKDFSYYLMDIGIAYREDIDTVVEIIKQVSRELRDDEEYKDFIIDDLEVLGLDQFGDSAVIIKARIKTEPIKQWFVGREFNRRMKYAFDANNVEIPFPHQTLYFGEDHEGRAPYAHVKLDAASTKSLETKKKRELQEA